VLSIAVPSAECGITRARVRPTSPHYLRARCHRVVTVRPTSKSVSHHRRWRFFFAIEHEERVAIIAALTILDVHPEDFEVVTELFLDGSEGPATVTLYVDASDETTAIGRAVEIFRNARQRAGLAGDARLLGFVPPSDVPDPIWDQLERRARAFLENGEFEAAVIWAQTACETLATETLQELFAHEAPDWATSLLGRRSVSLRERATAQAVFNGAFETKIQKEEWWSAYDEHVLRRNAIVHEGATVARAEAERSLASAAAFIRFVMPRKLSISLRGGRIS
jgi:hypothetical protein